MIIFSDITIRRGTNVLLKNTSALIKPGRKVGLVGKNGTGKSTLFSILKEEISTDSGSVSMPSNWRIAAVSQETPALDISALDYVIDGDLIYRQLEKALMLASNMDDGNRIAVIHDKLDAIDAWTIQARAAALLYGLGFTHKQLILPVKAFSGGWRMRLNLAQALLCPSDLLLLDEPTNHLDLDAIIWFEKWLKNYRGTLILISHDRDFLDPIVNKILHISQQSLVEYSGNYSNFERQKAIKISQQQSLYQHQQQKIAHLKSYIDRFKAKASKAKQAQSRIKMLEKMEKIAPAYLDNPFYFRFKLPDALPNPLLVMENAVVSYGNTVILDKIKLNLVPGSRIGLLGRNGAGKSTLIKLLAGEVVPQSGQIKLAKGIKLGYFAQHQLETLCADQSALWHLIQLAPLSCEQELRNYLGGFGFLSDKVIQPVENFSGGERARLVLALIIWNKPNLLLLDEPTNHLDMDMRIALTEALIEFNGALVLVSHDRHLLRSVTDEFYLVNDKQVVLFSGDLEDYQQWLFDNQKKGDVRQKKKANNNETKLNCNAQRKMQKRTEAMRRSQTLPLRRKLQQCEEKMDEINRCLAQIEVSLSNNTIYKIENKLQLTQLLDEQIILKNELNSIEQHWCCVQQQLDDIMCCCD